MEFALCPCARPVPWEKRQQGAEGRWGSSSTTRMLSPHRPTAPVRTGHGGCPCPRRGAVSALARDTPQPLSPAAPAGPHCPPPAALLVPPFPPAASSPPALLVPPLPARSPCPASPAGAPTPSRSPCRRPALPPRSPGHPRARRKAPRWELIPEPRNSAAAPELPAANRNASCTAPANSRRGRREEASGCREDSSD